MTGLVGAYVFAGYVALSRLPTVQGWQLSAQALEECKGFLRLRIDPSGLLTVYPVAVDDVCHDWVLDAPGRRAGGLRPAGARGGVPTAPPGRAADRRRSRTGQRPAPASSPGLSPPRRPDPRPSPARLRAAPWRARETTAPVKASKIDPWQGQSSWAPAGATMQPACVQTAECATTCPAVGCATMIGPLGPWAATAPPTGTSASLASGPPPEVDPVVVAPPAAPHAASVVPPSTVSALSATTRRRSGAWPGGVAWGSMTGTIATGALRAPAGM